VVSGMALVRGGRVREAVAVTRVTFRALSDDAIARYVDTGEWRERAGGYAIQERGGALVRSIEGDYLNVVGLPVAALLDLEPGLA
jgi:septum formation protein